MLQPPLDKESEQDDSHSSLILPHKLPSSSKYIYFVIAAIIGTEFCERLCYYGVQGSLNLFLQTQLGQSKANASSNVAMFGGVCYLTPLIGGYLADTYLGRYHAILLFITLYLIGIVAIAIIAWILCTDHNDNPMQSEQILFWIALYIIALGTGGIKPNVSTLGAEQFETDEPKFSLQYNQSHPEVSIASELVPITSMETEHSPIALSDPLAVPAPYTTPPQDRPHHVHDPEHVLSSLIINEKESNQLLQVQKKQKESFFNWFYFSINLGSFFAFTGIAFLCQNINFGIGYSVSALALLIGIIIFVLASRFYRVVPPQGSVLSGTIRILLYGITHGGLDNAKIKYGNDDVECVKSVMRLLPFLAFNVMYWCAYGQLSTLFYAQGCQMDIRISHGIEIPIATLGLFDVIPILILVPFLDRILIPCLRKNGFRVTMLQRMGCGFLFAMLAMICAGILEMYRKNEAITDVPSACSRGSHGDTIYVTKMSIFYQVPQFVLVGISEVLASVTGLEFFFSQAPPEMRSILASLNLVTTGLGVWLVAVFILLVNIHKNDLWITDDLNDGHLDWYFFLIGALCFVAFLAFLWNAMRYEYNTFEKELLVFDTNKPNVDAIFDEVMLTTPMVDEMIINQRQYDYALGRGYDTPPVSIKDMARYAHRHA